MLRILYREMKDSDFRDYRQYNNVATTSRSAAYTGGFGGHKVSNPPNPLGRHPFNILTEDFFS